MIIPPHLQPYIITQNTLAYTPQDQAVWRFTLRQLTSFLKTNAHPFYMEGLKKTGITVEEIPSIANINTALQKIGWQACPVSGFIPPSIFMELQSHSILPIAAEIRNIEHILYTPAPDIIHEAAGHAPFLAQTEYSNYLKSYANVAKKALLSSEDLNLYEKIRELSDLKENKNSTEKEIEKAQTQLTEFTNNMNFVSEAAYLGRMNWWTAEYALFGDINKPHILGAGLLSSILESESCLKKEVKKIPLTVNCTNYTYNITKTQPQLFVAKDFNNLHETLDAFAKTLAYKTGGNQGLDKAEQSQLVNTIELNSGLQISGKLIKNIASTTEINHSSVFIKFDGPTQLSYKNKELKGHSKNYHATGYSTPLGAVNNIDLTHASQKDLIDLNIKLNTYTELNFDSQIKLTAKVTNILKKEGQLLLITFTDCHIRYQNQVLFKPEWGNFDLAIGTKVSSVFAGPADTAAYSAGTDFTTQSISKGITNKDEEDRFLLYKELRKIRTAFTNKITITETSNALLEKIKKQNLHWLVLLELYELSLWSQNPIQTEVLQLLKSLKLNTHDALCLKKGLKIAHNI